MLAGSTLQFASESLSLSQIRDDSSLSLVRKRTVAIGSFVRANDCFQSNWASSHNRGPSCSSLSCIVDPSERIPTTLSIASKAAVSPAVSLFLASASAGSTGGVSVAGVSAARVTLCELAASGVLATVGDDVPRVPNSILDELILKSRKPKGQLKNTEENRAREVVIMRISENHVSTNIGARKIDALAETSLLKITSRVIRTNMTIVPRTATLNPVLKLATIATTATIPPTPKAYFTAGTALIAWSKNLAGETLSGIRGPLPTIASPVGWGILTTAVTASPRVNT